MTPDQVSVETPPADPPMPNGHDPDEPEPRRPGKPENFAGEGPRKLAAMSTSEVAKIAYRVEATTEPMRAIAKDIGVSARSLTRFKEKERWTRMPAAPKRKRKGQPPPATGGDFALIKQKLLAAVDRQIDAVNGQAREGGAEEKSARALATLAKTLETLMALERDGGARQATAEPVNRAELREALARKIAQWSEEGS
jgi:hypothetical protein